MPLQRFASTIVFHDVTTGKNGRVLAIGGPLGALDDFVAFDSKEVVGCKIKGVKHILQTAGDFGITVDSNDAQLGLFFFVGASAAKDESQKKRYEELRRVARTVTLDKRELQEAR